MSAPSCAAFLLVYNVNIATCCTADALLQVKPKMSGKFKPTLGRFGASSEQEIAEILKQCNAVNANKATKCCTSILYDYINGKSLPKT